MDIKFIPTFQEVYPEQMSTYNQIYFLGASSGIGAGTAIHFAKNGAKVSITDRNEENLKKTAQKCEESSPTKEKVRNFILDSLFRSKTKKNKWF